MDGDPTWIDAVTRPATSAKLSDAFDWSTGCGPTQQGRPEGHPAAVMRLEGVGDGVDRLSRRHAMRSGIVGGG